VWLANVFWPPMRELTDRLGGAVAHVPADYQAEMTRLLDLIEARSDVRAEAHVVAWFARIDEGLVRELEQILDVAESTSRPLLRAAGPDGPASSTRTSPPKAMK
jgi:hypothetical protein